MKSRRPQIDLSEQYHMLICPGKYLLADNNCRSLPSTIPCDEEHARDTKYKAHSRALQTRGPRLPTRPRWRLLSSLEGTTVLHAAAAPGKGPSRPHSPQAIPPQAPLRPPHSQRAHSHPDPCAERRPYYAAALPLTSCSPAPQVPPLPSASTFPAPLA